MARTRKRGARQTGVCKFPECGRPCVVRGLCQTHHRQKTTTGKLTPIRRYRPRQPGTEKFAGLRLSPRCVELLQQKAERESRSNGATIAAILEEWLRDGERKQ